MDVACGRTMIAKYTDFVAVYEERWAMYVSEKTSRFEGDELYCGQVVKV